MGVRKVFNPKSHARSDASGKKTVIKYLKSIGIEAIENPNRYGIDLIVPGSDVTYEIEQRSVWIENWFYSSVHVPERKKKFMQDKMVYAVVNRDCNKIMFCTSEVIRQYTPIEIPNKAVSSGEEFYDVPLDKWTLREVPNEEDEN